ncbi:PucR family transcriptional regulator [Nocardioides sp. Root151]|uniref:PucR family transcriptional regulator n=1 Tax=Nocardioides sp. Root151 TaxID=1736475 RepID=UPI0007035554|nr:PucR family transcriptional regulator [Nocardioides sp. Root151]KQZ72163.1 hypothetical protein ASD66_23820 [Nocardioides sp. Root151]
MDAVVHEAGERFNRLGEAIACREEFLVEIQIESVLRTFPEYESRGVPHTSIATSARWNVIRALRALTSPTSPCVETEDQEMFVARERAEQGLPFDVMLDGYRHKHRVVRDEFVRTARARGASDALMFEVLTLLTDVADVATSRLVHARRSVDAESRTHADDVSDFVQRLLWGRADVQPSRNEVRAHGLNLDGRYRAVRGLSFDGANQRLCDQLRSATWNRGGGVVVELHGEVIGLVSETPDLVGHAVVALGEPHPLAEANASFQSATRVFVAAQQFGVRGVVGTDDLGLRVAIVADPEMSRVFVQRYIDPLATEGDFGDVLELSAVEYLKSKCELKRAARSLHVHPNTLKHRLTRFQQVSQCDLDDPRVLAELWWALEARSLESSNPALRTSGALESTVS